MKKWFLILGASLLLFVPASSTSHADIYTGGTGGAIANNVTSSGTLLISSPANNIFMFNSISVTMTHTRVGDVTIWLTAPNGDNAQLFRQPGTGTFGDGSDLAGVYTFVNSGAAGGNFHTAAIAAGPVLAAGTYNRSNVSAVTAPFTGADPDDFSVFTGDGISGTWTLNWRDNANGQTGTVTTWSMDIAITSAIPEPTSFTLLALGLCGVLFRRRK